RAIALSMQEPLPAARTPTGRRTRGEVRRNRRRRGMERAQWTRVWRGVWNNLGFDGYEHDAVEQHENRSERGEDEEIEFDDGEGEGEGDEYMRDDDIHDNASTYSDDEERQREIEEGTFGFGTPSSPFEMYEIRQQALADRRAEIQADRRAWERRLRVAESQGQNRPTPNGGNASRFADTQHTLLLRQAEHAAQAEERISRNWPRARPLERRVKTPEPQTLEEMRAWELFDRAMAGEDEATSPARTPRGRKRRAEEDEGEKRHMAPRHIGLVPTDIIWENLRIRWWELIIRKLATVAFVVALVIFWAIPVAVVGMISNINYITEKLPWLGWINDMPPVILGVVTGLLPSILLSVLMALVPIILRLMARLGGVPTTAALELRTQYFYFLFQVVQVFLVTTFSSAATSAVQDIIQQPQKAATLLAQYLPRASNFYLSYIVLQGLTFSSGALLQISDLLISKILGRVLDNTPRKIFSRWSTLAGLGWGTVMPVVTNLAVIAITYACIAPLVLGFGCIGLYLFYIAYRYNMLYVSNASIDTKGMIYPRALQQTTTGCYLLMLCLIGLFAISTARSKDTLGPLILMIILLVFTIIYHISLNAAVKPLLYYLPKVLESTEEELAASEQSQQIDDPERGLIGDKEKNYALNQLVSTPTKTKNKVVKFFFPNIYANYTELRKLVPRNFADIRYSEEVESGAYHHPSVIDKPPLLWIPRDEGGVSKQEIAHTSQVIDITDEDATLDENNRIRWNVDTGRPPIYQEKIFY
ncbi:COPII subunit, partial [Ascosphaera pollenicola]